MPCLRAGEKNEQFTGSLFWVHISAVSMQILSVDVLCHPHASEKCWSWVSKLSYRALKKPSQVSGFLSSPNRVLALILYDTSNIFIG